MSVEFPSPTENQNSTINSEENERSNTKIIPLIFPGEEFALDTAPLTDTFPGSEFHPGTTNTPRHHAWK